MGATRKLSPLILVFFYITVAHDDSTMTVFCTELPPEVTRLASYLDSFRLPLGMDSVQKQMLYVLKNARTLGNGFNDTFWIGITDLMAENEWVYSSNLQRVQTTNWASHEPNGKGGENCAVLFYPRHSQWADLHCDAHERFICEMSEDESGPMILG